MIDNSDLIYDSALEDPSSAGDIIDTLQEGRLYSAPARSVEPVAFMVSFNGNGF